MSEIGAYGQLLTLGIAYGYDTENGFTLSVFNSLSARVSADIWMSWNVSFNDYGLPSLRFEGGSGYFGVGSITGVPSIVTLNVQRNLETGDYAGEIGIGWTDMLEGGLYGEADIASLLQQYVEEEATDFRSYEELAREFVAADPQDSVGADALMFATSLQIAGQFNWETEFDEIESLAYLSVSKDPNGLAVAAVSDDAKVDFMIGVYALADQLGYL